MASSTNAQVTTGVFLELTRAQVFELRRQLDTSSNTDKLAGLRSSLAQGGAIANLLGGAFSEFAAEGESPHDVPECSIPTTLSAFKSPASRPPPPPAERPVQHSPKGEMDMAAEPEPEHLNRAVQNWSEIILKLSETPVQENIDDLIMRDTWIAPSKVSQNSESEDAKNLKDSDNLGSEDQLERRTVNALNASDSTCVQSLVLHPHSDLVLAWKLLSMAMILWDTLAIPLDQFQLGSAKDIFEIAGYITSSFWACDLVLSFFTGVDHFKGVEMRLLKIAQLYSKSWLPFDLIMLTIDASLLLLEAIAGSSDMSGLGGLVMLRVLRLVRLLRVLRLGKVAKIKHAIENRITDMHVLICARIVSGLMTMLLVNHFIACAWVALGLAAPDGKSWIELARLQDATFAEVYVAALHWSITQFMPATNNIAPYSGPERVFAVLVVLLAMGVFSSFISSITNSVNALRAVRNEKAKKETVMRQFFTERDLSTDLFLTFKEFCFKNGTISQMLDESQVVLLKEVPEHLRKRLHAEMYSGILCSAVWMNSIGAQPDDRLLLNICHLAITERHAAPQSVIFSMGNPSNEVLIPRNDNAKYSVNDSDFYNVPCSSWLSEVSLWAVWQYAGWLQTQGSCTMVSISSNKFGEVCSKQGGRVFSFLKTFAVLVVGHVDAERRQGRCMTDLPYDEEILKDLSDRGYRFKNSVTSRPSRWVAA